MTTCYRPFVFQQTNNWNLLAVSLLLLSVSTARGDTIMCSKHGNFYEDSKTCECYPCFQGVSCEQQITPCDVDATQGNPAVYQEYWDANPTGFESIIPTNYRTGYQDLKDFNEPIPPVTRPDVTCVGIQCVMRDTIAALHALVGNAKTDDKWIVMGHGGSQLIAAASVAATKLKKRPVVVFAQSPSYGGYKSFATYGFSNLSYSIDPAGLDPSSVIEFAAYPNNPDGVLRRAFFDTSSPESYATTSPIVVYDMVYYWPSLFDVKEEMDFDIMMFSLSKLTGHGGSRFGWALVRDTEFAQLMNDFIDNVQIHIGIDTQYRSLLLMQQLVHSQGDLFYFIREKMTYRWSMLKAFFDSQDSQSPRFSLLSVTGSFYAWIRCNDAADSTNCRQVFEQAHIIGEPGHKYGVSEEFIRLELVQNTVVFEILLDNLQTLFPHYVPPSSAGKSPAAANSPLPNAFQNYHKHKPNILHPSSEHHQQEQQPTQSQPSLADIAFQQRSHRQSQRRQRRYQQELAEFQRTTAITSGVVTENIDKEES